MENFDVEVQHPTHLRFSKIYPTRTASCSAILQKRAYFLGGETRGSVVYGEVDDSTVPKHEASMIMMEQVEYNSGLMRVRIMFAQPTCPFPRNTHTYKQTNKQKF